MIPREDLIRMANYAGLLRGHDANDIVGLGVELYLYGENGVRCLERFAAKVAAHIIARQPPPLLLVDAATIDPDLLRSMLAKAPPMQLVPMPDAAQVEARAAAAEREACARICDAMDCDDESYPADCAIAIRARGAA